MSKIGDTGKDGATFDMGLVTPSAAGQVRTES